MTKVAEKTKTPDIPVEINLTCARSGQITRTVREIQIEFHFSENRCVAQKIYVYLSHFSTVSRACSVFSEVQGQVLSNSIHCGSFSISWAITFCLLYAENEKGSQVGVENSGLEI